MHQRMMPYRLSFMIQHVVCAVEAVLESVLGIVFCKGVWRRWCRWGCMYRCIRCARLGDPAICGFAAVQN